MISCSRILSFGIGLRALPAGNEELVELWKLDLRGTDRLATLPAGLGRLRNLEKLHLKDCRELAALHELQWREGLPALLAHLRGAAE
jgi:hypothetical protein